MSALAQAAKADNAGSGSIDADAMNVAAAAVLRHLLDVPGEHSLQAAALDAASDLQHPLLSGCRPDSRMALDVLHLCASQNCSPNCPLLDHLSSVWMLCTQSPHRALILKIDRAGATCLCSSWGHRNITLTNVLLDIPYARCRRFGCSSQRCHRTRSPKDSRSQEGPVHSACKSCHHSSQAVSPGQECFNHQGTVQRHRGKGGGTRSCFAACQHHLLHQKPPCAAAGAESLLPLRCLLQCCSNGSGTACKCCLWWLGIHCASWQRLQAQHHSRHGKIDYLLLTCP